MQTLRSNTRSSCAFFQTGRVRTLTYSLCGILLLLTRASGFLLGAPLMLGRGVSTLSQLQRPALVYPRLLGAALVLRRAAGEGSNDTGGVFKRVFSDVADRRKVIDEQKLRAEEEKRQAMEASKDRNVLGGPLALCGTDPMTGFTREGCCTTGPMDTGSHTVCSVVTDEFLRFSKKAGNDLSTPRPQWMFPGLKSGDRWCLCAARWQEAFEAGMAPKVVLRATHQRALQACNLEDLKAHAVDAAEAEAEISEL